MLSGSFVVAGSGRFQATKVGPDSYAAKLATEARRFQLTRSELMEGINTILRIITWVLIPVSALLLWSQLARPRARHGAALHRGRRRRRWCPRASCCSRASRSWSRRSRWRGARCWCRSSPRSRASPASTWCASTRRARSPRARSCSTRLEPLGGRRRRTRLRAALGALADDPNRNATAGRAGRRTSPSPGWTPHRGGAVLVGPQVERRARFDGQGLLGDGRARDGAHRQLVAGAGAGPTSWPRAGRRTLVLARSDAALADETLPADLAPIALVMFAEKVRPDAADDPRLLRTSRVWSSGSSRVTTRAPSPPSPRASGSTTPSGGLRRPRAARGPRRAGRGARAAPGVRPGDAAAEAGDGRRAAVEGPRRGHDRRRRERRARAQGRRHRRGHGLRRGGDPRGRAAGAARRASSRPCPVSSPRAAG